MFAEDLTPFFNEADFAVSATIGAATVLGIFDRPYFEALGPVVGGFDPTFTCATADVSDVQQGDTLAIGAQSYRVKNREDDGTGVTTLRIAEAT